MSKGEILEHKGEGLYRVRQKLAVERIQQELTQVQARLAELAVELPTAKLDLIHADDAVRDKAQEIEQLIPDYAAGSDGALQKITALQNELIRLQSEAGQLRLKVAELIAEDLANRKRQNQLEQVPEGREMDLWCADYSVELTGEVGLVDINDEGGQGVLIQPGFEDDAAYDPARDGALFPNLAQSGAQIYFNAAVLPGVQKWFPRYRAGTILSVDGDTCSVELDDARSSIQNLPINERGTLVGVPIVYMDCNGLVFEEGDRVVIRFTQNGPLVVGFESNPKECGLDIYLMDFDYGVVRMSPDMHTVKEVRVPGNPRLRDFAITDDKLMVVYEKSTTYIPPGETESTGFLDSRVVFENSGFEINTVYDEPSFTIRQVAGANSNYFLLELNSVEQNTAYAELYDIDGNYVKRVDMTSPNMQSAAYSLYHLPANDESVLYSNINLTDGYFAISQTSLINGSRLNYFDGRVENSGHIFATKNRIYALMDYASSIEIYDAQMNYVGSWPFTITQGGSVRSICVTRLKGYIFSFRAFSLNNGPGYSEVAVFKRDGDTFILEEVVDLKAEHNFDLIPKSMPDMKKLLSLDA